MKPFLGSSLVCLLVLSAAAEPASRDKLKGTPYYPLQVGTTWHYRAGDGKFTMSVAKHEKAGDSLCALVQTKRDGKVVGSEHLAVTADGVYRHDLTLQNNTETFKPPILVLKLPPRKGDSWKVDSKSDGKTYRGEFRVEEEKITVPAGTYNTFRVRTQDLEVNGIKPIITSYFAENVGMVKQTIELSGAKIVIELEKFKAGGK